ncbi:GAF domain protein [Asticcacaulis biprosthecium C19]|uniref:GAF domain protein n=1 Tax=Asticcacaulis biprosthecium C19 TaxID=715226 RepID=F4QH47_9CAUL|nr:GAF domain-containing protein [Asticcacaulis biprosthecium]EGF92584.1 GAF domain protein [Asticcacaulis biprosthecium C19]
MRLGDIRSSLEGLVPSVIATLDENGMPNVSYLSHVHYVDDGHVALSNQFFSKTSRNIRRLNAAQLMVVDGRSGQQHVLDIAYVRSEEAGPLFERMAALLKVNDRLAMMKLRSADIYRVLGLAPIEALMPLTATPPRLPPRADLARVAEACQDLARLDDADALLEAALDGLEGVFGTAQALILTPDNDGTLSAISHRGYGREGVGAEVAVGDGLIGLAASTRQSLRISDLRRSQRYASAVAAAHQADPRHIPLPGLSNALSQMAAPMICQGQLAGVVFVESDTAFAFRHEDESALAILAVHLAAALRLSDHQARQAVATPAGPAVPSEGPVIQVKYHGYDDSVFIDDAYVVRGVPGRLLHSFVSAYLGTGQDVFSNREIRRDPALKLPEWKDNLETRLILLKKRLDEKAAPIRLERLDRGRLRLMVAGRPQIEVA